MLNEQLNDKLNNSLLNDYMEDLVLNTESLDGIIENKMFKVKLVNPETETSEMLNAIDEKTLNYVVFASKLETMISIFNRLKDDNNAVFKDKFLDDVDDFISKIGSSIEETNKHINDSYEK